MSTLQIERTAAFIDRRPQPAANAHARPAFGRLFGLLMLWRKRAAMRRQLCALCELDDHLLEDIGLIRSELWREAMRPFWIASGPTVSTPCGAAPRRVDGERRQ